MTICVHGIYLDEYCARCSGTDFPKKTPCAKCAAKDAEIERLREALLGIAGAPLPPPAGYECAWCGGVRKHAKDCPAAIASAALAGEGK